jgi:hypothetical protein
MNELIRLSNGHKKKENNTNKNKQWFGSHYDWIDEKNCL